MKHQILKEEHCETLLTIRDEYSIYFDRKMWESKNPYERDGWAKKWLIKNNKKVRDFWYIIQEKFIANELPSRMKIVTYDLKYYSRIKG